MPTTHPIATSGAREPTDRPRPIPRRVRDAIALMVVGREDDEDCAPLDIVAAARDVGMRPHVLRRYFDRPAVRALIRSERRAFREMLCGGNEAALKRVRDKSANRMVTVAAVRALEQMDAEDGGRAANAPAPGVVIRIVNQTISPATGPTIDITPQREHEPALPALPEPIFRIDR